MMRATPGVSVVLASTLLGGIPVVAQQKTPTMESFRQHQVYTNIPTEFPATSRGRQIAKAMAWTHHRRNHMSETERLAYGSTPPDNFVYDPFLSQWQLKDIAPPAQPPYPALSFSHLPPF